MVASVPASEPLTYPPAWALARVPGLEHGAAPLALERLCGGSVNEVFRIDTCSARFVLRLDGPAWRRPGVDRDRELLLHRCAAAGGIAPALVAAEPAAQGLMISEFQSGRLWQASDYADVRALQRLGERLRALHALPVPDVAPFDPWRVAQDYLRQIEGAAVPELGRVLERLWRCCMALPVSAGPDCVVHGDLSEANLLEGSRLWLLDWEYAQRSDALMDLACILAYYPAAGRHAAELAAAAGLAGVADAPALAARLEIYRTLSWLWHLARGEHRPAPEASA